MSGNFTSRKPDDPAAKSAQTPAKAATSRPETATGPQPAAALPSTAPSGSAFNSKPIPQRMIQCPKCGADAREVARFCPRCHATLRFACPACKHEQRKGGSCEKCGVDFAKYISAVVAAKRVEADQIHERFEKRTNFMKHVLWIPVTGGLSLLRFFLGPRKN